LRLGATKHDAEKVAEEKQIKRTRSKPALRRRDPGEDAAIRKKWPGDKVGSGGGGREVGKEMGLTAVQVRTDGERAKGGGWRRKEEKSLVNSSGKKGWLEGDSSNEKKDNFAILGNPV